MESLLRDLLDTADRLGLTAVEHVVVVLVVALLLVVGKASGRRIVKAIREAKIEPAPEPISDGGVASDRENPPAQGATAEPTKTDGMG